ncbi:UDP-glucosyltransferase 2-like [Schistocerca cancellata]|uniref:UDP-glucosyltransferase 2-like n=1 Tax=Schistocerca cancellata TaxID=274614 RepID=UPI0021178A36|nr:UDP-glucosyltransferase 2-like [Schistocerca cancellata]
MAVDPRWLACLWVWILMGAWSSVEGARVLAVMPTPSISHQTPIQAIAMALVARGHHVTLLTTDPMQDPPENLTQIDLSFTYKYWMLFDEDKHLEEISPPEFVVAFMDLMANLTEHQLQSPQVQELIQSGQQFDLFVLEASMFQAYFGLYHVVGSPPLVGFVSLGMLPSGFAAMGNPDIPSFSPSLAADFPDHMNFIQRLANTLGNVIYGYLFEDRVLAPQEQILRKYFGDAPPPVAETERNYSLMLVNNHFSVNYPRPYLPTIIELTGLHIQKERKPLPKEVREFLDGAEEGAVYFSLGTNVRSSLLPSDKVHAIIEALGELPQRILLKWETGKLPEVPPNVLTSNWFPQQDVLAHPNVRVFVTQGGLQSMNEAAYFGVPTVGIPFLGDQPLNVAKMAASGIGIRLDVKYLTKESLLHAIKTVLEESSYKENMQQLSVIYREHQAPSLDRAIWWLEYVLRHNGTRHMRSPSLDFNFWQLWLIDVLCVIAAIASVIFFILYARLRKLAAMITSIKKLKSH